jgi:hypothetical protein
MPRGDKSKYTDKEKRQAEHIEEGYLERGVPRRKPSAAPGPRSTKYTAVVKNVVAAAMAGPRITRR